MTRVRTFLLRAGSILLVGAVQPFIAGSEIRAQDLRGSIASMDRQVEQATAHDFSYLDTAAEVRRFVSSGYLVPIRGNADYDIHGVSQPYGRPEVRLFVERLSSQYRSACGEKLVVTSLTRPRNAQPANASARSVHPTGMAVDLRVPANSRCRSWLESVLVSMEGADVIEATRERRPPHYHIAVFPRPYAEYVERRGGTVPESSVTRQASRSAAESAAEAAPEVLEYRVRRGDTLWGIARSHGISVNRIVSENGLRNGRRILAGQVLKLPAAEN